MTDEIRNLRALLEKSSDADLLREMIGFTAQRLMGLEVEGRTGAAHGERSLERLSATAIATGYGRRAPDGFALSVQPGESHRRPANNRAPGASVPMVATPRA
jgi:hypothetical protein